MFSQKKAVDEKLSLEFKNKLTRTQQDVLNGYIGRDGIYLHTIRENKDINLGTKLLYLERAIKERPKEFLTHLKQICLAPEKESSIELVRALKVINDLYHNNQIQYGDYGVKRASDHFFNGCGKVDLSDLQLLVREAIHLEVVSLKAKAKDDIDDQANKRKSSEWTITGNENLPIILDLPMIQRAPSFDMFYNDDEWVQKRDHVRAWLLRLKEANIVDEIFTDSMHSKTAHVVMQVLHALAWSDIPFTRENVGKVLKSGTARIYSLSTDISNLSYYKLDSQTNFNTIINIVIPHYTSEIMKVMSALHWMGVPTSQANFDKLIANRTESYKLNCICGSIRFVPGGIRQSDFDMLIDTVKFCDEIYKKIVKTCPSGKPMERDTFLAIMENVRKEKTCPTLCKDSISCEYNKLIA